ncbi:cdc42 homolog [Aplysia californica]|uniref:Cdc42 homolog n=1 Tax=Aplysia californica TaxID=6500 RepID=A0ABM1A2C9_APLCA|nr:cdc42 homolog [Aplysia californica]
MTDMAQGRPIKCVVVGDGGVGKTSMLVRFVQGHFHTEYSPTDFDTFSVTMAVGNEWTPCSMTLMDTAGQETYDRLRTLTYSEADVFIVCFSVASRDSFSNVRARWLPELKSFKPKVPIILVGTQSDLREDSPERPRLSSRDSTFSSLSLSSQTSSHVTYKEGKRLASEVLAEKFVECSARTGDGLDKIFYQAMMTAAFPKRKRVLWQKFKRVFAKG